MKRLIFFLSIILLTVSCTKEEVINNPPVLMQNNRMLLMKVDYLTYQFEEGIELIFNTNETHDSIPMTSIVNPPGDFGDITILHQPTGDSIFFGTTVWMGLGERYFPESLIEVDDFETLDQEFDFNPSDFQLVTTYEPYILDPLLPYPNIHEAFGALNGLAIVKEYVDDGAHIGVIEYAPSQGIGDPNDWDYYIMLYK